MYKTKDFTPALQSRLPAGLRMIRRLAAGLSSRARCRAQYRAFDHLMSRPHLARDIGAQDARQPRRPEHMRPGFREGHL